MMILKEMSRCETIFNLANTMVGSGVLAVPYAFRLTSYWAVALLLLVVALTAFTACLIGDALKLSAGGRGRDFIHLAEAPGVVVFKGKEVEFIRKWVSKGVLGV